MNTNTDTHSRTKPPKKECVIIWIYWKSTLCVCMFVYMRREISWCLLDIQHLRPTHIFYCLSFDDTQINLSLSAFPVTVSSSIHHPPITESWLNTVKTNLLPQPSITINFHFSSLLTSVCLSELKEEDSKR